MYILNISIQKYLRIYIYIYKYLNIFAIYIYIDIYTLSMCLFLPQLQWFSMGSRVNFRPKAQGAPLAATPDRLDRVQRGQHCFGWLPYLQYIYYTCINVNNILCRSFRRQQDIPVHGVCISQTQLVSPLITRSFELPFPSHCASVYYLINTFSQHGLPRQASTSVTTSFGRFLIQLLQDGAPQI